MKTSAGETKKVIQGPVYAVGIDSQKPYRFRGTRWRRVHIGDYVFHVADDDPSVAYLDEAFTDGEKSVVCTLLGGPNKYRILSVLIEG